jgi:predicted CoA-binding protein
MNVSDHEIKSLLEASKKICVIGLSPDPTKPSHSVPLFMKRKGWEVIGVYPKFFVHPEFQIYSSLSLVPREDRKFINVFRASDRIPEVIDEVLDLGGTEFLWLQLGISNTKAEAQAEAAGLKVVSDRCLLIEHRRIWGPV